VTAEPWYPAVAAAAAGDDGDQTRLACLPFCYGRWDGAARAHAFVGMSERARPVLARLYADGAFDWLDDPAWFTAAVTAFLDGGPA